MTHDFTSLVDQARQAAEALQLEIDAALDRHGVLVRFVEAMTGAETAAPPAPPVESEARTAPKPGAAPAGGDGRAAANRERAAVRVSCPDCGKDCSLSGLGVHRARAHKTAPFTDEPITKGSFDEQTARDAVAGPPTGRVLPMHNGRPAGSAAARTSSPADHRAFSVDDAADLLEAM